MKRMILFLADHVTYGNTQVAGFEYKVKRRKSKMKQFVLEKSGNEFDDESKKYNAMNDKLNELCYDGETDRFLAEHPPFKEE